MTARPHFHLFGTPIRIEPVFWVVAVLLGYGLGDARVVILWVAVLTVSVLVHELGHALALKGYGQSSSILLHGFGGLTFSQRRLGPGENIIVSLAGPFAAIVVLGVPAMLVRDSDTGLRLAYDYLVGGGGFGWWPVIYFLAYVNIWWSILNLVPVRPLDGGHVLTAIVGLQRARLASAGFGAATAVWAYTHTEDFRFAAFLFGYLAFVNMREYQEGRASSAFDVEGPAPKGGGGAHPGHVEPARSGSPGSLRSRPGPGRSGPPVAADLGLGNPTAPLPSSRVPVTESLVWSLLRRGNGVGASAALARLGDTPGPFLAATVALLVSGDVEPLVDAYRANPDGPANLVPAAVLDDTGALDEVATRLLDGSRDGATAAQSIQTHLHYADRFPAAAALGERIHPQAGSPAQVAFDTACSWARAGDPDRALVWIDRAIADGFSAARLLDGEPDLAAARARPGWHVVRRRLDD